MQVKIEELKIDDLFRIGKSIYVRKAFNQSTKSYSANRYDDINSWREFKKGKLVDTELEP